MRSSCALRPCLLVCSLLVVTMPVACPRDGGQGQMMIGALVDEEHGRRPIKFGAVEQPRPQRTFDIHFGDRLQLVGASLPEMATRGDTIEVTLQLLVVRDGSSSASPKILLQATPPGTQTDAARDEHLPVAGKVPASTWLPGDLLIDTARLTIPPGEGASELIIQASVSDTGGRWPTSPKQRDDRVELGRIQLKDAANLDAGH